MTDQTIKNDFHSAGNEPTDINPHPGNMFPYEMGGLKMFTYAIPSVLWHRYGFGHDAAEFNSPRYSVGNYLWGQEGRLTSDEREEIGEAASKVVEQNPLTKSGNGLTKSHNDCATMIGVIFRAKAAGGEPYASVFTWAPSKRTGEPTVVNLPTVYSSGYMDDAMNQENADTLVGIANKSFHRGATSMKELLADKAAVAFPIPVEDVSVRPSNCALRGIRYE